MLGCQSNTCSLTNKTEMAKLSQIPNYLSYKGFFFLLCLVSYAIHPHLCIKIVHHTGGYINTWIVNLKLINQTVWPTARCTIKCPAITVQAIYHAIISLTDCQWNWKSWSYKLLNACAFSRFSKYALCEILVVPLNLTH